MTRRKGFTLVELLVVIGIIAVLVGILLPTLASARRAASSAACLSNARQLAMGALLFAHDHKGYLPIASDDYYAKVNDPLRQKWSYRTEPGMPDGSGVAVFDWASSLIPYMGGKVGQTFITAPLAQSKIFRCPADNWLEGENAGYQLFTNVAGGNHPVSYGYNADIACVSEGGVGRFARGGSDSVGVYWGPGGPGYSGNNGQPLQCKLGRIQKPSEVLLFADCGTRPPIKGNAPLDQNDALYYTTNYMANNSALPAEDRGKLSGVLKTGWLKERLPMLRHGGKKRADGTYADCKINVAFADGHGESVNQSDFNKVRVTPYAPR